MKKETPVPVGKRTEMIASQQDVKKIKVFCRYCSRSFESLRGRNVHENVCILHPKYDGVERFICNVCFFTFKNEAELRFHQRKDCGLMHKCKKCKRVFSGSRTLNYHVKRRGCKKKQVKKLSNSIISKNIN